MTGGRGKMNRKFEGFAFDVNGDTAARHPVYCRRTHPSCIGEGKHVAFRCAKRRRGAFERLRLYANKRRAETSRCDTSRVRVRLFNAKWNNTPLKE